MFELLLIVLGIFLGWNLPQPEYAKRFEQKVMSFFNKG